MKTQRAKGSNFERSIASDLLATYKFEKHECYRTPLSGGHAAHAMKADITLTGSALEVFPAAVECKHYRDWHPGRMFDMRSNKEIAWHEQALRNASESAKKLKIPLMPLLICKGNFIDPWACFPTTEGVPLAFAYAVSQVKHCPHVTYTYADTTWTGCKWSTLLRLLAIDR